MHEVEFATVLPGAIPFKDNRNVNDTYRGQVLLSGGVVAPAILKDLHPQELANELLTLVLARALGLPVPDGYLAVADPNNLQLKKGPQLPDGRRLGYASLDAKQPALLFRLNNALTGSDKLRIIEDLIEWTKLGDLYGFDAWVANVDRHRGNLLFGGSSEVWLIDHGHCYTGPTWQPGDLVPDKEFRHRMVEWLTPFLKLPQRAARAGQVAQFKGAVAAVDLEKATDAAHSAKLLSTSQIAALKAFLADRVNYFVSHANRALGMLV